MPTVVARFAGFLLILLLLASSAGGMEGPSDEAEFHYLHGSAFSGEIEGTCQVAGFRFDTHAKDDLVVNAATTELVLYRTWRNSTIVHVDNQYGHEILVEAEQKATHIPVPDGPLRFEWNQESHLFLTQGHLEEIGNLSTIINDTNLQTSHAENGLNAGPGYYIEQDDDTLRERVSRIKGPARWMGGDQDRYEVQGDGFFRFDALQLYGESFKLEMPPYKQYERHYETPVSYISSIVHTDAVLKTQNLDITIPSEKGLLGCGDFHGSGNGAATYRVASGEVKHGNSTHGFDDLEFTLNGEFSIQEFVDLHEQPWSTQAVVKTQTTGNFASGTDYELLSPSAHSIWSVPMKIGLLAMIAGLAFVLWKLLPMPLFTRLERDKALEHPIRAYLFEQARTNPGSTLAEAVRATGTSYSTIQHHGRQLVTVELLALIRFGRDVHLFPAGTARARARRLVSLRRRPVRFLVEQLQDQPRPMRHIRAQMQDQFGKGASWATRIVSEAEKSGLVERIKTQDGVMLCGRH